MIWTPERIDLLKKLWADGLSASEIAAVMGGISRCGVLGKAHRLDLASRKVVSPPRVTPPKPKQPPYLARSNLNRMIPVDRPACSFGGMPEPDDVAPGQKLEKATRATRTEWPAVKKKEKIVVSPPDPSFRCTIVELTSTSCRWPIGDPLKPDFRFCGATMREGSKLSYCAYHEAMAYQPPRSKAEESKAAA